MSFNDCLSSADLDMEDLVQLVIFVSGILRWCSEKYFASAVDDAKIVRNIYNLALHSCRQILSIFQQNCTCSFIFISCGSEHVRIFLKLKNEQYRLMISFWHLETKLRREIRDRLDAGFGYFSSLVVTIKTWINEFQSGHTSISQEPRQGTPKWLPQRIT